MPLGMGLAQGDVRQEAHQALLDDWARAAKQRAAAHPAKSASDHACTPKVITAPAEDPVNRFFRTGVLVGDHTAQPAKKICVGPCEGGELLNLRSAW